MQRWCKKAEFVLRNFFYLLYDFNLFIVQLSDKQFKKNCYE